MKKIKIAPSILSADFSKVGQEIADIQSWNQLKAAAAAVEVSPYGGAYLDCNTAAKIEALELPKEGQVVVASKGGTLTDPPTAHDAGIFYLPDGRYYIVTICTTSSNLKATTKIINEVGLVMYEAMK